MTYNISLRDDPPVCKECEALRHDVGRYVTIAAKQAQELEKLRALLREASDDWIPHASSLSAAIVDALRREET